MKVLNFLLILILLSLPFGELLRFDLGNNISLKPLDLLVVVTAIYFFLFAVIKNKKLQNTFLNKPLIIFSTTALFSLLINSFYLKTDQLIVAFLYWLRFVCYASIYFIILSLNKNVLKKIPAILLFDGLIILILGFIQYFLYPNLRNLYYLGWDEHNYRLFSVFLDPNFAGAFFVLYLIFLLGFQLSLRAKRSNLLKSSGQAPQSFRLPRFFQSLAMTKYGIYILSGLTFIAIFLTYSRSALLMLVVGVGTYLILIRKKNYLFALIGLLALIITVLIPTFNKENTNLLRITSSLARVESYNKALRVISDHPFFGVGFNAYRYAQQSYGVYNTSTKYQSHGDAGADSSLLFVTATTGVVGFTAYLYLWFVILKLALSYRKQKNNVYSVVLISSIVGLFVNSIFINSLFFPIIMLWMWITISLIEVS